MRLLFKCSLLAAIGFVMFVGFQAVAAVQAMPTCEEHHCFDEEDAYRYAMAEKRFNDCNFVTRWLLNTAMNIGSATQST